MNHDALHEEMTLEQALALLGYMAHHSEHHAQELLEASRALPEKAVVYITEAVALLTQSNEKIRAAIKEAEG
ncbi:MAG: hypothetical protein IJU56_02730 [Clostridia bacterium]|nr:hypothetical protein [Clostridia bacterium]